VRRLVLALLLACTSAAAQPARETPDALPPGPGRDVTFHVCTPCHSTALIRRSGLTRPQWDALMDWMSERQNMPVLNPALRTMVVDYLAEAFPPRRAGPRGRATPFAD
jgi:Spy/CpxP family protein refolding chaperone